MKKLTRVILAIFVILIVIALSAWTFLQTFTVFGVFEKGAIQTTFAERADNYYDGHFHNEVELSSSQIDDTDYYKDRTTGKDTYPEEDLPVVKPSFGNCPEGDIEITWYGHTTLLIQMHGMTILVDPVFSDYMGLNKVLSSPGFQ